MADEKKENSFSKFFKKIGKSIDDAARESRIESAFRALPGVEKLTIYADNGYLIAKNFYGKIDDVSNQAVLYKEINDEDIPYSSILSTDDTDDKVVPKRYYVIDKKFDKMDIEVEEKDDNDKMVKNTYTRAVTILTLDPNLIEVKVIKARNSYYLVKEKKN